MGGPVGVARVPARRRDARAGPSAWRACRPATSNCQAAASSVELTAASRRAAPLGVGGLLDRRRAHGHELCGPRCAFVPWL